MCTTTTTTTATTILLILAKLPQKILPEPQTCNPPPRKLHRTYSKDASSLRNFCRTRDSKPAETCLIQIPLCGCRFLRRAGSPQCHTEESSKASTEPGSAPAAAHPPAVAQWSRRGSASAVCRCHMTYCHIYIYISCNFSSPQRYQNQRAESE